MKAVQQNFRSGELTVADVPPPSLRPGGLLVRNAASLVSAGTERAAVELAKMNPVRKARTRPDLVRKVLARAQQDGLLATAQVVLNLVSAPLPLGYSCAGIIEAVGAGVGGFQPGERVACAGGGYANHAEVVFIPRHLAVAIPDGVGFDEAAFVTVGAIALQGVRQAELQVGESVVVIGLGLVGQLVAQICAAAGGRVFGVDRDLARVALARDLGAGDGRAPTDADLAAAVRRFTRDRGADAVIICAATPSSEPVRLAAELARDRARVVALGDVGLNVPRRAYYEKELDLRQSRSYGPGRYDPAYEERGQDYPIGYVRWTENRNMEAFLDLVAQRKVRVEPLVTHRFPIEQAPDAYARVTADAGEPAIGILLEYDLDRPQPVTVSLQPGAGTVGRPSGAVATRPPDRAGRPVRVGVIGAGQFAQGILLPRLRGIAGIEITAIATAGGLTARSVAEKYGARLCTSDYRAILADPEIDAVLIVTRHNLHAELTCAALAAGKHVFVEKPLALTEDELSAVIAAHRAAQDQSQGPAGREGSTRETAPVPPILMVGFNRRFSPLATTLKRALRAAHQPLAVTYRVNAGPVPAESWVQDPVVGGGRIVGEVCHFVDFLQYLTDARPLRVVADALDQGRAAAADPDSLAVQLRFDDGSIGSIAYLANGDPGFPKERIEVFGGGSVGVIDNWRRLQVSGSGRPANRRAWLAGAKGHAEELAAFVRAVRSGEPPIPLASLVQTTQATFAIQQSLRTGQPVFLTDLAGEDGL